MRVRVAADILAANDELALANRALFDAHHLFALNLISSPGAGKTTLLERTIADLSKELRIAVIEGDIATSCDADRITAAGAAAVQINTDGGCHLDSRMIARVLPQFDLERLDLLFIENVGNLVCPAEFALGEHVRAAILSVPEGDDKPLKYPVVFQRTDVVLVNKIDLLPFTDCDVEKIERQCRRLNPDVALFRVSCRTGEGLQSWYDWLRERSREVPG